MPKKKSLITVCLVAWASMFIALASFFLLGGSLQTAKAAQTSPVQLTGTWNQTSGMSGTTMTAIITDGKISIDIDLVGQNTTGLYWSGSFDTRVRTNSVFNINSTGDRALMDAKLFASQDANKIFSYKNGDLSFQFSMLGMTSTVHLSRSSE